MKAVIYARYSSDKQNEHSIERQIQDCTEFAKRNDIQIIGSYIDRALSARSDKRPEFQRMIGDSKNKQFQAVIVYRLDRFSRNRCDSAIYKTALKKNGVKVLSAMENITDSPESIIIESLFEGMAEFYSAELSQKVRKGMIINAQKGLYNGSITPFGYYVNESKRLAIDGKNAPIVRDIFQLYADGITMKEVITTLNTKYNTKFTRNSFSTLLKNKKYIGIQSFAGIETKCPAIIEKELFVKVQERMNKNKQAPGRAKAITNYLLTGKVFCECGANYIGDSALKKDKRYNYYSCANRKNKNKCDSKPIPKEKLEDYVVSKTIEKVLHDNVIEEIANSAIEFYNKEVSQNTVLNKLELELKEVNISLNNIQKAIEQGIFSKTTSQRMQELEDGKETLELRISQEKFLLKAPISKERIIHFLSKFKVGDLSEEKYKENVCNTFVNKIIINKENTAIFYNYTENGGISSSVYADLVGYYTQKTEIIILDNVFCLLLKNTLGNIHHNTI